MFKKILPDEEFLPKAPNPEDIIYVDDSEAQVADGNDQSEFLDKENSEGGSQEIEKSESSVTETNQSKAGAVEGTENLTETDQLKETDSQEECDKNEENNEKIEEKNEKIE